MGKKTHSRTIRHSRPHITLTRRLTRIPHTRPTHTRDSNTSENWTRTLRRILPNPQHTRTRQLSMRSRTTDVRAYSVRMPDARGIWRHNRRRSTRPPTRNSLWHKDRHRRLGRIRQKKQGVPENTSHGDPLEDSKCKTERSEIQTSNGTRSKPPPDPTHLTQ